MSLTLVYGPANAGKAGRVLAAYRDRLAREPLLVVPTLRDVERAELELAGAGVVFGARVVRPSRLFERVAERAGVPRGPLASPLQRQLVVERAMADAPLRVLRRSAGHPGFSRSAARFVAELEQLGVGPAALDDALGLWAGQGPRRAYAGEVAAIYRAYRDGLERAGLASPALRARRAVDALRREPFRWGGAPVLLHGFDDFTPLELDLVEALSGPAEAEVWVSLPYERGRAAFRAVAETFERLAGLADRLVELEASAAHYHPGSRTALHRVERGLFEPAEDRGRPAAAVQLHRAGGERAEVELVAARVLELLRGGTDPGEVAVVFRDPRDAASLVEDVFTAYGIPVECDGLVALGHTPLGRGLLALLRCALLEGDGADLLAYLRTPGLLDRPAPADRLEADARRAGTRDLASVRALWEARHWPLEELDRLRRAPGPAGLVAELHAQAARLATAPYRRRAGQLGHAEARDLEAWKAVGAALQEVRILVEAGSLAGLAAARLHDVLAALEVPGLPVAGGGAGVALTSPEGVRARRFEAVFVCGLQEGEFPRRGAPEPFLSDDDRRELAAHSGLRLPPREDRIDRERYLFYVCASRPERLLVLSSRVSDDEGDPAERSFLVEDVLDLFVPELEATAHARGLGDVTWPVKLAPTETEWGRALARVGPAPRRPEPDGLHSPEVLAWLAARDAFSAGALEAYADCGVKWLVEKLLDPQALEPDAESMVRGRYAHRVLEQTFTRLREVTGSARVTAANLVRAEALLREALSEHETDFPISPSSTRVRAAVRRLELDLMRFLRSEAASESPFEPAELELGFGLEEGGAPALHLGPVKVRGRIDRVDSWGGHALVRDYKSGRRGYPVARWEPDRRLQAALYMLAARQNLGLELAGGLYEPLGAASRAPRGVWLEELSGSLGPGLADNDGQSPEEIEGHLARASETACAVVAGIRAGQVAPSPDTCDLGGGCSYPSLCRRQAA